MISPPDETRRRCISDRVPFPILKPVPRCGTIVENGGQTLRGDKPLFLGCNSLGHDALGASTPPRSSALYQAPSPSPSPSGPGAIKQQLSVCGIMSQRSVKQLTHLFRLAPLKSSRATSIWRARRGPMAPKPKPARFEFTVAMVLAMALTILAVMTWADRDLAALSSSATYHPQLLLL